MANCQVLIVSASPEAETGWLEKFRDAGCQILTARSHEQAVLAAETEFPEVVLVDDSSDDIDPLEVSWQILARLDHARCPVFVVSFRADKSIGTDCCADPAAANCLEDMVRRVTSYLGRQDPKSANVIELQGLTIDRGRHRVVADGRALPLTPTEFRLLWELAHSAGFVFSRPDLTRSCLGSYASVQFRTIDVHIKSMRQKLGKRAGLIETVRGVGYRFVEHRPDQVSPWPEK